MAHDRINCADGSCVTVDTVFIKGLKAASVIGCYDWERDIRQTLVIDLELKADFSRAAETDALEDALDYAAMYLLAFPQLLDDFEETLGLLAMTRYVHRQSRYSDS